MIFRIQRQKKPYLLHKQLAEEMQASFIESFSGDHNMIIEEFGFYQQLPPRMQTELVNQIFGSFVDTFDDFF